MHAPTAFLPGFALLITMIPGLPGVIIKPRDDLRLITPGSCRPAPAASGFLSLDRDHGESSCSGPELYRRLTCTFNKEKTEQKSENSYEQMHRRRYLWESLGLEAPAGQTWTYTYCFAHHAAEMPPAAEELPFPYFAGSSKTDVPPSPEEDLAFALALAGMRSEAEPPAEGPQEEGAEFRPRERAAPRGDHHQAQSERRWEQASGTTIGTGHIGARRGGRPKVGPYESDPGVDHEAIIRGIQEALLEG
eukprot:g8958.t1